MIRVVFTYVPEDDEIDNNDSSGLTLDAFERLTTQLDEIGATDVDIRRTS